jgi:hypothetical protein
VLKNDKFDKSKASDFYTTEKVAILGLPFPVTPRYVQPHMGTAVTNRIGHADNRISMSSCLFQLIFERVALTEHTLRIIEDNHTKMVAHKLRQEWNNQL